MTHEEFLKLYDPWVTEYYNWATINADKFDTGDEQSVFFEVDSLIESGKMPPSIGPLCKRLGEFMKTLDLSNADHWPNIPEYDAILRDQTIEGLLT